MATATTSRPVSLPIQLIATEVSRPPEYAKMTRSDIAISSSRKRSSLTHLLLLNAFEFRRQFGACHRFAGHDHDGVVTRDRADDVGQRGTVDGTGQVMRRAWWSADHRQIAAGVRGHQQIREQPRHPFSATGN